MAINFLNDRGSGVRFELFGDWAITMKMFQGLNKKIKDASLAAQLKVCKVIATKVKLHLRMQDLGWKPLSPDYIIRKQKVSSRGTLMLYNKYYESIEAWTSGSKHLAFVGVKKGIYSKTLGGKKNKLDVATVAAVHEFAKRGGKIPRRPLWNPTIAELGGKTGIKKMYTDSLVWQLRKRGVRVNKTGGGTSLLIGSQQQKFNPFR